MIIRLAACVLVACGSAPAPAPPPPELPWTDFYGIRYQAPLGTDARLTQSVLPGPGGLGGSPVDERPYVTLIKADGFYVTITKTPESPTLDETKASWVAQGMGRDHAGKVTATGWEMTYRIPRSDDPTKTSTAHLIVANLAGGHYQCSYDEQSCRDAVAAEAICRSMRARP